MSLFSEDLRLLRSQKSVSQQAVADEIFVSRSALSKYEEGRSEPPIPTLVKLVKYYHISMDILTAVDLHKVNFENLMELGDNRILFPVMVDWEYKDNIGI